GSSAEVAGRLTAHFDLALTDFQQSPTRWQFLCSQKARWRQIEAFATQSEVRLFSEWLVPVGHKISAGDLAFNQYRMGSALPSDGVRHLTADAGLLGEDYSAAIASQPSDSVFHELGVSHGVSLLGDGGTWK